MISVGFDPAFIDTVVRAEDEQGNLMPELPKPGYHHRRSTITRVAGGNAVNVAYVLKKLGNDINLVIPSNNLFDELLKQKGMECVHRIHETVNETVAVAWEPGEIQFNQVIGEIGSKHYTESIHKYWTQSPIHIMVNWGLNYQSHEWISCLWLASCGWNYEEIDEIKSTVIDHAIETDNLQHKLVLEPGGILEHPKQEVLHNLLSRMAETSHDNLYPVFLCNEEEDKIFAEYNFHSKIIHTSQRVICWNAGTKQVYEVPQLKQIKTFVGAGDSFLAGIVHELYQNNRLAPSYAISVAQKYMTNTL